jgi:peptide/nickel transport system substrate-binding protein
MHRKVWFLVSAAVAVFALTGTAAAMGSTSPNVVSAKAFHMANTTPKQRAVSHTLNFGMEQDVSGFDSLNANQDQYWAVVTGETPVIRGNYIVDNKGNYHLDLASSVKATKTTLTITIKNNAYWYWQGHAKSPVTADDYIYTWQQIMKPGNDAASTTGYSNITSAHKVSPKKVVFHWHPAFADYQDLFGFILPKAAFSTWGSNAFNTAWTNCVCDHSGNPVSDGPYYLNSYTTGAGVTLKPTPAGYWYGHAPALSTVNFKLIIDNNSEYTAYNGGEIDAMAPAPNPLLHQYLHKAGTHMSVLPSFTQEHLDINLKGDSDHSSPSGSALLKNVWMRQAIMEGIDRKGIINAVFTGIAAGLKPLNNPVWNLGTNAVPWMATYNFNPGKAIALLKAHHCTGGPTKASNSNSKIWTCAGHKAQFNFKTTTRATRTTSSAIIKANLQAIGIKISVTQQPSGTFFGTTTPNKDFDLGEYAWIGGVDPSGFDAIYQCQNNAKNLGGQNYKNFCLAKVDSLIKAGDANLNPTKRIAQYQAMAKLVSSNVPIIPLYGAPTFLVYNTGLKGMTTANNPTSVGPTWNIETWHW